MTDREPYTRLSWSFAGEVLEALLDSRDDSKLDAVETSCADMCRIAVKVATKLGELDSEEVKKFTNPPSDATTSNATPMDTSN